MLPLVSIQILNYDGGDDILRCLRSVQELDYGRFRVTVIDNASADGSVAAIETAFPDVHILRNSSNLGFGTGHNVGFREALGHDCDFVWILNQDAWVAPDSLTRLVRCFDTSAKVGAVSPVILNPDDTVWFSGGRIDWIRMRASHTSAQPLPREPFDTGFLTGCALLLSRQALESSRGFDERFFLYYEDADISLRLRNAGFSLLVAPDARVWHAETSEQNRPDKVYWLVLSGILFFRKHASGWRALTGKAMLFLRRTKNAFDIIIRPDAVRQAVRRAYHDADHMKS